MKTATSLKTARFVAAFFLAFAVAGCTPRGETRTTDQIFADARSQFVSELEDFEQKNVQGTLQDIAKRIDAGIKDPGAFAGEATAIADLLNGLVRTAGYQNRPSFGELIQQYASVGKGDQQQPLADTQVKLLAARTYWILTSEMKSTKFAL